MTRDVYQCVDRMITVDFHLSARAGFPFKRLRLADALWIRLGLIR